MEYLKVGVIVGSFGLDGSVKIFTTTNFPYDRFKDDQIIYLAKDDKVIREVTCDGFKENGKFDLLALKEILTKEDADALKGYELLIDKNEAIVPEGFVRFVDLVGCKVVDENNEELGQVIKVEEYPAQETLRIKRKNGKQFLVPYVDAFIKSVDITKKEIVINIIEGML